MSNALPKAVRRQIEQSNKIIDELYGKDKPADEQPPVEQPIAAKPVEQPAAEKPPVEQPAAPTPPSDTAEQRYKVLQGKYNAEVPRLNHQVSEQNEIIRDLRQRQNNLEALIASMNTVKAPAAEKVVAKPAVSPEEIEQFGPDLINLIERVSRGAVLPEVATRLKPVEDRFAQVEQNTSNLQMGVARSAREKLIQALTGAVPSWEQQNKDPIFLGWLDQVDPYSGVRRGELLTRAFNANDTNRVIAFFTGFLNENAAVTSDPSKSAPVEQPEAQRTLDDLVAPGTPKTGSAGAQNESGKRVWTQKDIQSLYAQKNEHVKRNAEIPKELAALERDLIKAQREGRIRL
jgi:hypothetical protein